MKTTVRIFFFIHFFLANIPSYSVNTISFSPDSRYIVTGDKTVKLWDIITGQVRIFSGHSNFINAVSFSSDGRYIVTGSNDKTAKLWDVATGAEIRTFKGHSREITSVSFSPDGKTIVTGSNDNTAKLWDATKSVEIRTFSHSGFVKAVSFSHNGRYIVIGDVMGAAKLWDPATGAETCTLEHPGDIYSASFNPDDSYLLTAGYNGAVILWDLATCTKIRTFIDIGRNPVSFSPDGKNFATGVYPKTAKLWDIATGEEIRTFKGHSKEVTSISFSPDGRYLVTGSNDNTAKLWDIATGSDLATFMSIGDNDWIANTPDYYYSASKGAFKGIHFRIGNNVYLFEQFDLRLNRPDIVLQRIGKAPKNLVESYYQAYQKRLKRMNFTEDMLGEDYHLPEIARISQAVPLTTRDKTLRFKIKARDSKYLLDRLNVFVNDVPIYGLGGIDLRTRRVATIESEIEIELGHGRNKVQVSVLNEKGAESLKETFEINYAGGPAKPDLYLVAIGVSRYQDGRFNLEYAAKDAKDLINTLKNQQDRYAQIHKIEILDARVTRENIVAVKDSLMKSQVDDAVILFISGHGLLDANLDYYFATADIDFSNPTARGLPYEAIESLLDGIPARKKLLLMDTCHSGEVDKEDTQQDTAHSGGSKNLKIKSFRTVVPISKSRKLGLSNSFQLMQELFANLSRGSGAVVISAAAGVEFALEDEAWQNGVFTYSLLEGLKTSNADANGDGEIRVSELKDYVTQKVPALTQGQQTPTSRQENLEFDFRVY